jgi:5'-nucleotidase
VRILVSNDDGIHAEGLQALRTIAHMLSDDVWVCAPEEEQSGKGRALTLSDPLRVRRLEERVFAVNGTPTDCVMLAAQELLPGLPDLVLSGVNRGQNVAEDTTLSGTVAAAIQGMALGVPSIALSQALAVFHDGEQARFDTAVAFAPGIVAKLLELGWPADVVMNINFPCRGPQEVSAVEVTRQGFRGYHGAHAVKRTDMRGRDYYWVGFESREIPVQPGSDITAVLEGRISVTPLHIDLTHAETLHTIKGHLGGAPPRLAGKLPAKAAEA